MDKQDKMDTGKLEFLDMEPVVKEFVRRTDSPVQKRDDFFFWLTLSAVVLLAVLFGGIFICEIPVVTAVVVVVIETVLSICLGRSPIWLHGLVVIVNIVLGLVFQMAIFMFLTALAYLADIWCVHAWSSR